jgi:hypothetical protein
MSKINKHHYLLILLEAVIVLMLLILFPRNSHAQERILVHGIVYESESGLPLSGTHILVEGSSYGTISGPDGSFRLYLSKFPVKLKLSHVGFEDRYFVLESDHKHDTIMLGMKFTAEMLEGVTITDSRIETIFRDESYSVLDFEFHENGLVLLIYRNRIKKSELVLLSFMNDTLSILKDLPGKAASLHRDCRNHIHYCEQDTAYQVHFDGHKLELMYPVTMDIFKPVAEAFVAFQHGYYYFAVRRMHDQMIEYIRYDSIAGEYSTFRQIRDDKLLQILRDNPMHHRLLIDPFTDEQEFSVLLDEGNASLEGEKDLRDYEREVSIEAHYLRTVVYTPLYAPLFEGNDGLIIFNHPQSAIETLDHYGRMKSSTEIHYHKANDWDELILKDEIRDQYFVVYSNKNRLSLHQLDITSGQLGFPNILHFPFVKKVLVRNGYAYFTYRTPGSIERTMLFRQKLVEEDYSTAITK